MAATRAENLLIISTYDEKPDHGPWSPLYPHLKNVPELAYDNRSSHPTSETPSTKTPSIELEREQRDQFWQAVKKESFKVAQVTDDRADIAYSDERRSAAGRGAAYGTVIHQIFDDAINRRLPADPTPYVIHLLQEAGTDAEFLPNALDALQHFRNSEIWAEIQTSETVYTEVPFAVSQAVDNANEIIRGVIDLVYRLPKGWKIVDYKTNSVKTDEDVQTLCEQTADQVNTYAEHWENFTGETVVAKGLWLTERREFKGV